MEKFMDCICDNNLSSLVVKGVPTFIELGNAWSTLFYEYCDLIENPETKLKPRLLAEINILTEKIDLATGWVKILPLYPAPSLIQAMKLLDFDVTLDPSDPEGFHNDINRIKSELMSLRFDLRIKEAQYESIQDKKSTDEVVDRKYFYQLFDKINDLKKREAVNEKSTVMQFAIALSRYNEALDLLNQKAQSNARF